MNRSINWPGQKGAVSRSDPKVRERTLRLFLRQTRGITAWSDGSSLHEGEDLRELRAQALMRLIRLRGGTPDRAETENGRSWRNYQALCRMRSRTEKVPVPLADRMMADLMTAVSGSDLASSERRRLLRRALRRVSPDRFADLPPRVRCGTPELDRLIDAANRVGLRIRKDLLIDGFPVPAGTPVRLDRDGTARLAVSGLEHFPAGGLKVSDLRRDRTRTGSARVSGPEI